MYVVVRTDIPMAQQIVQAAHAACTAGEKFGGSDSNLILLEIKNLKSLKNLSYHLEEKNVEFTMFYEPDNAMGFSALATRAITGKDRNDMRNVLKKFNVKLWGKD